LIGYKMEIEVDITRDDFKEFNKYAFRKMDKTFFIPFFLFLIALTSLFHILTAPNKQSAINGIISTIFIILVFGIISRFVALFLTRYTPLKKGATLGKHKFRISEEGVLESTEFNESLTKWDGIRSVEIKKNYIFVWIDRHMAHIIPKRFFSSDIDCQKFLSALNERVGKSSL